MKTDKLLMDAINENRKKIILWLICGSATALIYPMVSLLLSRVIDSLEKGTGIILTVFVFLIIRLCAQAGGVLTDYLRKEAQFSLVNSGRRDLYRFLGERKPVAVLQWPAGKLQNCFRISDEYMSEFMLPVMTILTAGSGAFAAAILLFMESPVFLLLSVLSIAVWYVVTERINRSVMEKETGTEDARSALYEAVTYLFDHLEAVAASARRVSTLQEYERKHSGLKNCQRSLEAVRATRDELINRAFFESFRVILILLSVLWNKNAYLSRALLSYYLVENLYLSVMEAGGVRQQLMELRVKKRLLREIWGLEARPIPQKYFDPTADPLIRAEHISLRMGNQDILKDFSCQINRGSTTLIYGRTGQGKTTLVRCLLGIYVPDGGKIYNGSASYEEMSADEILKHFSVFMQNGNLFTMSLQENLFLSAEEENRKEAEYLLRELKLDGLLKREEGETFRDTCLSEEDFAQNKLSGGEIQRCRIVRTLLSGKEIYVFDEPSSQVDAQNEERICQLIGGLQSRGCTVILISHRRRIMELADYVIDMGKM